RLFGIECAFAADVLVQIDALHVFEGEKPRPLVFAKLVDGNDVLVAQLGGIAGLAAETLQSRRIGGHVRRQNFQSNVSVEIQVARLVNRAHASGGDVLHHIIFADANRLAGAFGLWVGGHGDTNAPACRSIRGGGTRKAWLIRTASTRL